jgi:hypothetical protein
VAEFFGGRLLRWITMPYRIGGGRGGRMFNAASRPFYQMADRGLGSQFLQDIAEFFLNFQSMYGGFVERAQSVEQLLHDRRTTFAVVTTLEGAPLREAETFCRELATRGFDLGALVLNKVLPDYLLSPDAEHAADVLGRDHDTLARSWRRPTVGPTVSPTACSATSSPRLVSCARSPTRSTTTRSSPGAKPSCAPS